MASHKEFKDAVEDTRKILQEDGDAAKAWWALIQKASKKGLNGNGGEPCAEPS